MHVDRETSRVGDPHKKILQKFDLLGVKAFCEGALMRLSERTDVPQNLLAVLGHKDLVDSSIGAAPTPLDEATPLKPIQHRNDPTRPHPDLLTESTLTNPGSTADQAEHTCVRRRDIQRQQCPLKTGRGIGTELREEEGDSMVRPRR